MKRAYGAGVSETKLDAVADRLHSAVYAHDHAAVQSIISDYPSLIDFPYGGEAYTLLCHAAGIGDLETVRILLRAGANINAADNVTGDTPLHLAADDGNLETVKYLLRAGAKRFITNRQGESPQETALRRKTGNYEKDRILDKIIAALGGLTDAMKSRNRAWLTEPRHPQTVLVKRGGNPVRRVAVAPVAEEEPEPVKLNTVLNPADEEPEVPRMVKRGGLFSKLRGNP